MKKLLKGLLLTVCIAFAGISAANAQNTTWSYKVNDLGQNTFEIVFDAVIEDTWHMYDVGPYDDMGPTPTTVTFDSMEGAALEGSLYQIGDPIKKFDDIFGMEIGYFEQKATFAQKVKLTAETAQLKGALDWMVCNDTGCAPNYWEFDIEIKATAPVTATADDAATLSDADAPVGGGSLWSGIIAAIAWGFVALLTPCIFPMVPMTVSFFMKGSENKAKGRFRAFMYGIFIILLYTLPIAALILITRIVGGDAVTADIFNWLSTHWLPNIIFFLVFMVFAASFFGAFEITMPSKLVNNTDRKSDKGGLGGVFFMAITLVLVSFSCTGPIVGSVLVSSLSGGNFWQPIFTMLAFSTAFALPFSLLALFPALLNKMPKSGGWLNSVKVVLGFIEVAFGLKFLSMADQAYHWGILDREIYLALWIAIFTLMGFYLLGKLKFKHDSEVKYVSVGRLVLSIITFAFVAYLVPGMWGAPLSGISGYLPPMQSQTFVLGGQSSSAAFISSTPSGNTETKRYSDFLKPMPYGIDSYFHYGDGIEAAKKANKPVFLDFTGHSCVNCREMEQRVWNDPKVQEMLRDDFVVITLYADDKKKLDEADWITTTSGKVLKELGRINSYFITQNYGVNAQPGYIIVDHTGKALLPPRGYNLNVEEYIKFLQNGIDEFNKTK